MGDLEKRRKNKLRKIAYEFNNTISAPLDLLDKLDCIRSKADRERIRRIDCNDGSVAANRELCSCLVGKTGWFDQLIKALEELQEDKIRMLISSDSQGSLLSNHPVVSSTNSQAQTRTSVMRSHQQASPGQRWYSEDTPVTELPVGVRNALFLLDQDTGLQRNWETLADNFDITWEERNGLAKLQNPSARVIEMWHQKYPNNANLGNLIAILEGIDRLDIVSDIKKVVGWHDEDGAHTRGGTAHQQEQAEFCRSIEKQHRYENNLKEQMKKPLDVKDQGDKLQKYNNTPDKNDSTERGQESLSSQGHPIHSTSESPENRRSKEPIGEHTTGHMRDEIHDDGHRQNEENQNRLQVQAPPSPSRSVSVSDKENPPRVSHSIGAGGVQLQGTDNRFAQEQTPAATNVMVDGINHDLPQKTHKSPINLTDTLQNNKPVDNTLPSLPINNSGMNRGSPISHPVPQHDISPSETCTDNTLSQLPQISTPQKDKEGSVTGKVTLNNKFIGGEQGSLLKTEDDISSGPFKSLSSFYVPECKSDEILVSDIGSSDNSKFEIKSVKHTSVKQEDNDVLLASTPQIKAEGVTNKIQQNYNQKETTPAANRQNEATDLNKPIVTTTSVGKQTDKDFNLDKNQPGKDSHSGNKIKTMNRLSSQLDQTKDHDNTTFEDVRVVKVSEDASPLNQVGRLEQNQSRDEPHEGIIVKPLPLKSHETLREEEGPRRETDFGHDVDVSKFPQTNDDNNYTNENMEAVERGASESQVTLSPVSDGPQPLRGIDVNDLGKSWGPLRSACLTNTLREIANMSFGNNLANYNC